MKKHNIKAVTLALVVAAGGSFPSMVHAKDECILDGRMRDRMEALNKAEIGLLEGQLEAAQEVADDIDIKEGTCMPVLKQIDNLISMRLPTFGGGWAAMIDKIKSMACKFADDYVREQVESIDISYEDPYGITKVGVGGSTTGGGVNMEEYDLGGEIADAAMEAAQQEAKARANSTGKIGDSISGPKDRRRGTVKGKVDGSVRDAFKGL